MLWSPSIPASSTDNNKVRKVCLTRSRTDFKSTRYTKPYKLFGPSLQRA